MSDTSLARFTRKNLRREIAPQWINRRVTRGNSRDDSPEIGRRKMQLRKGGESDKVTLQFTDRDFVSGLLAGWLGIMLTKKEHLSELHTAGDLHLDRPRDRC